MTQYYCLFNMKIDKVLVYDIHEQNFIWSHSFEDYYPLEFFEIVYLQHKKISKNNTILDDILRAIINNDFNNDFNNMLVVPFINNFDDEYDPDFTKAFKL